MSRAFPDHPFLRGNYRPLRAEVDAPDLEVEGELPEALEGTLYRNGPNPLHPPRDSYHYFTGDGMIHAVHFEDGRVSHRSRWARTRKWQLEERAGKSLFGSFGNPLASDPSVRGEPYNVANTHIIEHAGRLFALEEQSPPFELAPVSLDSIGPYTWDGALPGAMTAHPKLDPGTGELHAFAYAAEGIGSTAIDYLVIDADGKLVRADRFQAPYSAMVHDFAITEHYAIFPIFPATFSIERAMKTGAFIAWDRNLPSHLGVLRRGDPVEKMRWLEGDACYSFHPLNACDDGETLRLDMVSYPAAPGFPSVDGERPRRADAEAFLERWTVDLAGATDSWRVERLDDHPSEFPRVDERVCGRPYRHGYLATSARGTAADVLFDSILHLDLESGASEIFTLPEGDLASEPVFVPRRPESAEGDGFLLSVVYRGAENRSEVVVLDAGAVDRGPVATVHLETRVPNGFHGSWAPRRDPA